MREEGIITSVNIITKVYNAILKQEMTLEEYLLYKKTHPSCQNINALQCVECGDMIILADGQERTYFKHTPTHEGHGYCSLYEEGRTSNDIESITRKKLMNEQDVTLNFELRYFNQKWHALITIPPFKKEELIQHESNQTRLTIDYFGFSVQRINIPINREQFYPGVLKNIPLNIIPSKLEIRITGKSAHNNISYVFSKLNLQSSLFSTLIQQDYKSTQSKIMGLTNKFECVDLTKINEFVVKKICGTIYCGRHYVLFKSASDNYVTFPNDISYRKLSFWPDGNFDYDIYDIVFNKSNLSTSNYCSNFQCNLVDKMDVSVIWPPVQSIGNYKYCNKRNNKIFASIENDEHNLDLIDVYNDGTFFRITGKHAIPFYVTNREDTNSPKEVAKQNMANQSSVHCESGDFYFYCGNALIKKIDDKNFVIPQKGFVIQYNTRLQTTIFSIIKLDGNKNDWFLALTEAIIYSLSTIPFSQSIYNKLKIKYTSNQYILDYLDLCLTNKTIKQAALEIMMEV